MNSDSNNTSFNNNDEIVFDTQRLVAMLWRYWYLFLISPIIGAGVAYLYKRYQVPQYSVSSSILIRQKDKQGGLKGASAFDMSSMFSSTASNVADEMEILKSRTLMVEVLQALHLNPQYYAEGRVKRTPYYKNAPIRVDSFFLGNKVFKLKVLLRVLDSGRFEATINKKKIEGVFGQPLITDSIYLKIQYNPTLVGKEKLYSINIHSLDALADAYLKKIAIANVKTKGGGGFSNAITLQIEDAIQERGTDILNKLIETYNTSGVEDKNAEDKAALQFVTERIATLTSELSGVEKNIEVYKKQQGITADATTDLGYLFQRLGTSEEKINEFEVKKSVLKMLGESFAAQAVRNQYSLMPTTLVTETNSGGLYQQIQEYNKLIFERDKLLKQVKPSHPSVLVLEKQIAQFSESIQQDIKNAIQNMDNEVNASLDKFKAQNAAITKRLKETPQKERELLEIGRSKTIKENLYLFLLQKREETALALASTVSNAKILDAPSSAQLPSKPAPGTIILIAVVLGIFIPVAFFSVKIYLDDSIEKEDDIRSITNIPYIGFIAHNKDGKEIVMRKGTRTPIAETFRLLRSNLQFLVATAPNKVVAVTSSMSGEGKSFVTLNLGLSLAIAGKKTIILGFDLRRPRLTIYTTEKTHKDSELGLTNYLVGDAKIEQIIRPTELSPNLYYIASGPIPPNPAELMMQDIMADLFQYLEANFDYVIVDTAPVGLVVDMLILNKYSGCTLYVTRANVTRKKQLHIINNFFKEGKINNPSIVLNDVRFGRAYGYGQGYGYGYGYGESNSKD